MEWRAEGTLISLRKHGENAAIIEVLTAEHGLHAGVVRGASSRKMTPILQPGSQIDVTWKARLEDHLGSFTVEPIRGRSALIMNDRLALAGLNAICGLLSFVLAEREPHADLYLRTQELLDLLGRTDAWPLAYLRWEVALLDEMGFGMDLTACAVTGHNDALIYVSPRSGRAVSASAAGEWADRLLPLPPVLLGEGFAPNYEILQGLQTTGYFLANQLAKSLGNKPLPAARQRLIDALTKAMN
ncbi:DNA repair protein RecO [Aestuariibius sp. HNIBRBA575]|uniref:DNA repair protein RecO n=1 Tax=Aestuariibius sp. HNIBRBA575 TaxID=3233343 RepID=UPI0034A12B1E